MTSTAVEDCILSVDSIIRLGGAVADDDSDDESERIQTALLSAGEKYGLHFEGQEARILQDSHGNYVGSSLPIIFKGTFKIDEKISLNHFLARHSPVEHYCCVPGCKEPMIKSSENKYSNGQAHIRRHHPELVPFSLWTNAMLRIREAAWTEQKTSLVKRKASSQEVSEAGTIHICSYCCSSAEKINHYRLRSHTCEICLSWSFSHCRYKQSWFCLPARAET